MGQRSLYLTEEADHIYCIWRNHGRSASRKVSRAIVRLFEQETIVPALQPGDERTSVTGEVLVWTTEGWKVKE
jgi:hypothetical protein